MSELRARVSTKGQTVIPKAIRDRLQLKPGDTIRFRIDKTQGVVIDKLQNEDDPFVTFEEWNSHEDNELYRDL
jgi:AbrB family looped-hinge helix DNA binding protein